MKKKLLILVMALGLASSANITKADSDIVPIPQPKELQSTEKNVSSHEVDDSNVDMADEEVEINGEPLIDIEEVNETQFRPGNPERMDRPERGPGDRGERGPRDGERQMRRPERTNDGERRMGPPPFIREMMRERASGGEKTNRGPGRYGNRGQGPEDREHAGRGSHKQMNSRHFMQNRGREGRGQEMNRNNSRENRSPSMGRGFQGRGFGPGARRMRGDSSKERGINSGRSFGGRGNNRGLHQGPADRAPEMVKGIFRKMAQLEKEIRILKAEVKRLKGGHDRGNDRRRPSDRMDKRSPRPEGRGR